MQVLASERRGYVSSLGPGTATLANDTIWRGRAVERRHHPGSGVVRTQCYHQVVLRMEQCSKQTQLDTHRNKVITCVCCHAGSRTHHCCQLASSKNSIRIGRICYIIRRSHYRLGRREVEVPRRCLWARHVSFAGGDHVEVPMATRLR